MKKFLLATAVLPLLVACNNQGDIQTPHTPFTKGQQVSITSQPINEYERAAARKVHVREEVEVSSTEVCEGDENIVTRLLWDEGDQIDVFVDDDAKTHSSGAYPQAAFTLVSGANTSEGTFHGAMPAEGTVYAIMYPHRDASQEATKTIVEDFTAGQTESYKVSQFYMPSVQEYRAPENYNSKDWPSFASGLLPIFGKGNLDSGFVTYPCGGVMRFKLWSSNGEIVNTIRLAGRNNEYLAGSFEITPTSDGAPKMQMAAKVSGSGKHSVLLKMPTDFTMPTTQETAVWIYFVLPAPLTFSKGFSIYTYNVEVTDYESPTQNPTHSFVYDASSKGTKPTITQNHITTIQFGNDDDKGNNGKINGVGWN